MDPIAVVDVRPGEALLSLSELDRVGVVASLEVTRLLSMIETLSGFFSELDGIFGLSGCPELDCVDHVVVLTAQEHGQEQCGCEVLHVSFLLIRLFRRILDCLNNKDREFQKFPFAFNRLRNWLIRFQDFSRI